MNGRGDYPDEMADPSLDDAGAEALLRGEAPAGAEPELAAVAAFVRELRASAAGPAPAPSPALAALLRDGLDVSAPPAPRRGAVLGGWRRRLAVAGIGFGVAVNGVVAAGAAGLLPRPVERVVGGAVKALTPLHLPERVTDRATDPASPGLRPGGAGPATTPTSAGTGAGATAPRSGEPQTGPAPAGGPTTTGGGSTSTTVTPAPGVTVPGITSPSVPPTSATTTAPTLPPLPLPALPNVSTSLPVAVPPLPTLPGLPW